MKYLIGWKQIAKFLGCHERTARRWHSIKNMPIIKLSEGKNGSVRIEESELKSWLKSNRCTLI